MQVVISRHPSLQDF
ncbi:unnamed protein product, partial [Rotaria sp. Silwood1]